MANNPVAGTVALEMGGETYTLLYDWTAIGRLNAAYAGTQNLMDPATLADVLEIGLVAHHPDIKAADIFAMRPPLMPAVDAVTRALSYAFHGDTTPEVAEENPPKPNRRSRRASASR